MKTLVLIIISAIVAMAQLPTANGVGKSSRALAFSIGSPGGQTLTTAAKSPTLAIPFSCVLGGEPGTKWTLALGSGDAGTVTVKFWRVASGAAAPTVGNSISTSGLAVASGTQAQSATFTDFTSVAIAVNDSMAMAVTAITGTVTSVTGVLPCH